ncbi:MAG: hydroxysqualene dehydroxylase HpnE [Gemmataceae bacterium]
MSSSPSVLIVGGGLAGLAAATALAARGCRVTLLEARQRLGGRASSFTDAPSGQLVDNCQHVSMGCCTNLAHFFQSVGVRHFLQPQECLYFMTPDGRVSRLRADPLPAPLHLARSFLSAHYLTAGEKARIAWGLAALKRMPRDADPPLRGWLEAHRQTPRTMARFWGLILTSALNETVDRLGVRYARKVFVDAFLGHRRGFQVEVPAVPLGRLYGDELQTWLDKHGVTVRLQEGIKRVVVAAGQVAALETRQGERLQADHYAAAVPYERLLDLLPAATIEQHACFAGLRRLETSPIASVHLWYEGRVLKWPHLVLIDTLGQWVFERGSDESGVQYVQVVISAARGLGHAELEERVKEELARLLPAAASTRVVRCRVVTEHAATFSAVPGVDAYRPGQETPLGNLFLAGDWTATGWPATMEGAVRSGYLCAEAILRRAERPARIVLPDL